MKKKNNSIFVLPHTDGMIRLASFVIALLILAVPLSVRRIFRPLPAQKTESLNLELICSSRRDAPIWKRWAKYHNPAELFAFSRSPEEKYLPQDERRLIGKSLRSRFTPELPKPKVLKISKLPELSKERLPLRIGVIPSSVRHEEYDLPQLGTLDVLDGNGISTDLTITPVSFRGTVARPVLFRLRAGQCGNELELLHSSGDRAFDAGVRRKLLKCGISGTEGKLLCVWPQTAVKENLL